MTYALSQRRLSLVKGDALARIVRDAVDRAMDVAQEGELVETLVAELSSGVRKGGRQIRGMSRRAFLVELERTNSELLRARDRTREELAGLKRDLEVQGAEIETRHRTLVRQADESAAEHERRAREELGRLFERARVGAMPSEALQAAVEELLVRKTTDERHRVLADYAEGRDREIDNLRRRIDKLNRSLAQAEAAVAELAAKGAVDPGLASIYREVQGLDLTLADAAQRRALLAEVFRANLLLRGIDADGI